MRRRSFLTLLVTVAGSRPIRVLAQKGPKLVGVLLQGGPYLVGFDGLKQTLEAEAPGTAIRLVLRDGHGDIDALKAAATEFEGSGADLLVTFGTLIALAAKEATRRTPIVFIAGGDPVQYGLVQSISKPGGRLTGVASYRTEITPKRFALLKELMPSLKRVITFSDASSPVGAGVENARLAARALDVELLVREVRSPADVRAALNAMRTGEADAFFFPNQSSILSQSQAIIERATSLGMATMAQSLGLVADGALAGYGLDYRQEGRLAAKYVLRILTGTHPSELPVEVNERHVLGINLKTAKALGLTIPPTLLARADEVIE